MEIKVLGINSSPIKDGNVENFLNYVLEEAKKEDSVTIESISLRGLNIADCNHCNWCMKKQTTDKPCSIKDDALPILNKMKSCHILVLASPVYFLRMSGTMACLIDRTRCLLFGKEKPMALRNKIGVALTVGWEKHGGIETTLESLHYPFLIHEMWTPSLHLGGSFFGVGAVSGPFDKGNNMKAMDDNESLQSANRLIKKAVVNAKKFLSSHIM